MTARWGPVLGGPASDRAVHACLKIRGELAIGRIGTRKLVCGRSVRILTMMQSCALRRSSEAAGPNLAVGVCTMSAAGSRHLGSSIGSPS
jgi:hypothetical protein